MEKYNKLDIIQKHLENELFFIDIDVEDLPLVDLEKLLIGIRIKSVGETVKTRVTCPECGENFDYLIDFEKLETEKEKDYIDIIDVDENIKIKLQYPSVRLLKSTLGAIKSRNSEVIEAAIESIITGNEVFVFSDQSPEEREEFLLSLNSRTLKKIRDDFLNKAPKNVLNIEYTCPKCGKKTSRRADNLISFFT